MLLGDSHLGSRLHRQPPPDELKVKKQQTEAPKCLHVVTLLLHTVVSTFCFVCAASSAPPTASTCPSVDEWNKNSSVPSPSSLPHLSHPPHRKWSGDDDTHLLPLSLHLATNGGDFTVALGVWLLLRTSFVKTNLLMMSLALQLTAS